MIEPLPDQPVSESEILNKINELIHAYNEHYHNTGTFTTSQPKQIGDMFSQSERDY